ncbi:MAG TPA: OmpA family protein [bacterium]|nr:OmpA family protein [bacterium]
MKSLIASLGWILFLALAVCFLLFYNFAYLPRADRIVRQQNEINMWIGQLQQMNDSVKRVEGQWDSTFKVSYSFDELFGGATDLKFVPSAESLLRACVTSLQSSTGPIEVAGHAGGAQAPQALRERFPGGWDYAAAAAGAVASRLAAWGVDPDRIRVEGYSDSRPAGSAASGSGPAAPRVDIVVRNQ